MVPKGSRFFDDVAGWNTEPYLGAGEFYLDYGDYDYKVTVPYDYIVVGSGELANAKEVHLRKELLSRWDKTSQSDKTVYLMKAQTVSNTKLTRPTKAARLHGTLKIKIAVMLFCSLIKKLSSWDAAR